MSDETLSTRTEVSVDYADDGETVIVTLEVDTVNGHELRLKFDPDTAEKIGRHLVAAAEKAREQ
jgi:hypothetical protein